MDVKKYLNKELYGMELVILMILALILLPAALVFII